MDNVFADSKQESKKTMTRDDYIKALWVKMDSAEQGTIVSIMKNIRFVNCNAESWNEENSDDTMTQFLELYFEVKKDRYTFHQLPKRD